MGEVWKARDSRLKRSLRSKSLLRVQRTIRARSAGDCGAQSSKYLPALRRGPNYLVMEFIEGTPLKGRSLSIKR